MIFRKTQTPAPGKRCAAPVLGVASAFLMAGAGGAMAFPLIDPSNGGLVPQGSDLAAPDVQSLQHQLQLVNGLSPPIGGGWTFLPRFGVQEMLTDNVFQAHSPRTFDLVTFLSPGIGVAGDLPRLQLTFDYSPTLAWYARASSLNSLTQQLNGTGLLTVVPDLVFVDFRAATGVSSIYGGIGGQGTLGGNTGASALQPGLSSLGGNGLGLNRDNSVQTSSFAVSPYLLKQFGDFGTVKVGYSLNVTDSQTLTGFAPSPFPSAGGNGQSLVTNEELAQYTSGNFLGRFQDSLNIDLTQSRTQAGAGYTATTTGQNYGSYTSSSSRSIVSDQLTYAVNRSIAVFSSIGYENIFYSGNNNKAISSVTYQIGPNGELLNPTYIYTNGSNPSIHDITWSIGTTLTPNPDSVLTISYGHQNGFDSLSVNGHYALTGRTTVNASYGSTLGTQLEAVQNQLAQGVVTPGGALVNGQTTGALFTLNNALGTTNGIYRTDTLTIGSQTNLNRDTLTGSIFLIKQSQSGNSASDTTGKGFSLSWLHQMQPDMTVSAAFSFSQQSQAAGSVAYAGNNWSVASSLSWVYQISPTLGASLQYSFLDRQSSVTVTNVYQNLLILGVTKTF
jgi:uncharacterized protein (PEP-CTERM system associated)